MRRSPGRWTRWRGGRMDEGTERDWSRDVESWGCVGWLRDRGAQGHGESWDAMGGEGGWERNNEGIKEKKGGGIWKEAGLMTIQPYDLPVKQSWIHTWRGRLTTLNFLIAWKHHYILWRTRSYVNGIFKGEVNFLGNPSYPSSFFDDKLYDQ